MYFVWGEQIIKIMRNQRPKTVQQTIAQQSGNFAAGWGCETDSAQVLTYFKSRGHPTRHEKLILKALTHDKTHPQSLQGL